ncbi:MAG: MFS transporter [Turicibacter sp.]|nr:MFS transporter [Turicibacter sp.]
MLKIAVLAISLIFISPPIINGILPAIRDTLELTQAQSEMFLTISSIAILFSVLASNIIIEKIGLKKTVFFGLLLIGFGGMLPVFTSHFTLIIGGRFILGTGLGLISTPGITYINVLFDEKERASLMGYRGATEQIGRSLLTLAAGALFMLGWNFSFLPYGIAFVLAILFYVVVPEVKEEEPVKTDSGEKGKPVKMPLFVYLTVPFIMMIVLAGAAIDIRYPALATEAVGGEFNSSAIIAVKPILGMVFASLFGKLYMKLGRKLLYIGLSWIVIAALLVSFSSGNLIVLTAGFWLGGVAPTLIFPFIMMTISKRTSGKQQRFAMSLMMASPHISVFLMTPAMEVLQRLVGSDELTAPYPILAGIVFASLIGTILLRKRVFGDMPTVY